MRTDPLIVGCPHCDAEPGAPCITSGARTQVPHNLRRVYADGYSTAYVVAYAEGRAKGKAEVINAVNEALANIDPIQQFLDAYDPVDSPAGDGH